jgi:hypothetical protein
MPKAEATGLAPLLIGTSRTLEHLGSGVFDFDGAISGSNNGTDAFSNP